MSVKVSASILKDHLRVGCPTSQAEHGGLSLGVDAVSTGGTSGATSEVVLRTPFAQQGGRHNTTLAFFIYDSVAYQPAISIASWF